MRYKVIAMAFAIVSLACSFNVPAFLAPKPRITNHAQPTLAVDTGPFESAGCSKDSGYWRCPEGTQLKGLGCDFIEASSLLGGLSPAYPMVFCKMRQTHRPDDTQKQNYLFWDGCLVGDLVSLVIYQDEQFQLIRNLDELKASFAPVDSSDEALSYAMAATGLTPVYGFKVESGYRYEVSSLEDTHVVASSDGFQINLYQKRFCGCGPHPFFKIDVFVDKAGNLKISERQPVFENPAEDDLCVD
jgi:hypothetical protein